MRKISLQSFLLFSTILVARSAFAMEDLTLQEQENRASSAISFHEERRHQILYRGIDLVEAINNGTFEKLQFKKREDFAQAYGAFIQFFERGLATEENTEVYFKPLTCLLRTAHNLRPSDEDIFAFFNALPLLKTVPTGFLEELPRFIAAFSEENFQKMALGLIQDSFDEQSLLRHEFILSLVESLHRNPHAIREQKEECDHFMKAILDAPSSSKKTLVTALYYFLSQEQKLMKDVAQEKLNVLLDTGQWEALEFIFDHRIKLLLPIDFRNHYLSKVYEKFQTLMRDSQLINPEDYSFLKKFFLKIFFLWDQDPFMQMQNPNQSYIVPQEERQKIVELLSSFEQRPEFLRIDEKEKIEFLWLF